MTGRRLPYGSAVTYLQAAALLAALPPDPDAAAHWDTLSRALGLTCTSCSSPSRSGGMCDTHYRRHQRATRNAGVAA